MPGQTLLSVDDCSRTAPIALLRGGWIASERVAGFGRNYRLACVGIPGWNPSEYAAQRLAAWAGVCPANHESAGKQKRRGTRKGNTYLKATLVTAAISASQAKGTYLRDKFHCLKAPMGTKKAAMTMAHKILVAAFHMLQRGVGFADLGADHLDRVNKHRTAKRLARRLDALGYDVMLRPKATA